MQSMTGYGKVHSAVGAQPQWSVECVSVNRKQLEVQLAAPRDLLHLEVEIRRIAGAIFRRGRIMITILEGQDHAKSAGTICRSTARAAAADLTSLAAELGISQPLSLELVLRHPLFSRPENAAVSGAADAIADASGERWSGLQPVLREALISLETMRIKEGAGLRDELQRLHGELSRSINEIAVLAPEVPVRHREQLLARIGKARLEKLPDEGRLATEVALFAERCDITEELARLQSHLVQFSDTLFAGGAVGRTLEFIVQELFREINTTGSKASDPGISRLVVDAKTLLDQIREQLANVE